EQDKARNAIHSYRSPLTASGGGGSFSQPRVCEKFPNSLADFLDSSAPGELSPMRPCASCEPLSVQNRTPRAVSVVRTFEQVRSIWKRGCGASVKQVRRPVRRASSVGSG